MKIKVLFVLFIFFISSLCIADNDIYLLSKNPFVKPRMVNIEDTVQDNSKQHVDSLLDDSLRATLSAGKESIANINGQMIFIGDHINGYKLISVGIGSATLVRNGDEITLNVSEIHKKLK